MLTLRGRIKKLFSKVSILSKSCISMALIQRNCLEAVLGEFFSYEMSLIPEIDKNDTQLVSTPAKTQFK